MLNIAFLLRKLVLPVIASIGSVTGFSQKVDVDLSKRVIGNTIIVVNREASIVKVGTKEIYLHLNEKEGAGIAWLKGIDFEDGTIGFDVKGKNVLQRSFVGIAFHGSNDSTYDAVYFRPFNFTAAEEERRNHSVQYISLPKYDWPKLRLEFPNKYEQPVNPSPGPEDWVYCRLIVKKEMITVFVNNNAVASLEVKALGAQQGKKLGFWVGNGSDGDFANLTVIND